VLAEDDEEFVTVVGSRLNTESTCITKESNTAGKVSLQKLRKCLKVASDEDELCHRDRPTFAALSYNWLSLIQYYAALSRGRIKRCTPSF